MTEISQRQMLERGLSGMLAIKLAKNITGTPNPVLSEDGFQKGFGSSFFAVKGSEDIVKIFSSKHVGYRANLAHTQNLLSAFLRDKLQVAPRRRQVQKGLIGYQISSGVRPPLSWGPYLR